MNNQKKSVLILIPSMANVGGTERMVHSLSKLLEDSKTQIFLASFDAPGTDFHFESHLTIHTLGPIPRLPLFLRGFAYALASWRLRQLKSRLNVDITISNLWGADLINILSGCSDRKISLCHINVVGNPTNRLMIWLLPFVAAIYRRFDHVVAVSETLSKELGELYSLNADKTTFIHNFVSMPHAVSRWSNDFVHRFIWCGRFSQEKNVDGLLHVWSRFASTNNRVQLILLGDGPQRSQLQALAIELGLKTTFNLEDLTASLVFAGKVPDPASYMLGARALLLSSYAEGLPMVVLEALSLGLPVLATDCLAGGVRTALQGSGTCNPSRVNVEFTTAGALLPIPISSNEITLSTWTNCLETVCQNDESWAEWSNGAVLRASMFSSDKARQKWSQLICF